MPTLAAVRVRLRAGQREERSPCIQMPGLDDERRGDLVARRDAGDLDRDVAVESVDAIRREREGLAAAGG